MVFVLTLGERLLKLFNIVCGTDLFSEQIDILFIAVTHIFVFFSRLNILMEFSLSRRVSSILKVNHIQYVSPGTLIRVNALC